MLRLKAQWTAQSIGMPSIDLYSVYFVNADTGYATGYDYTNEIGMILKTTDGGTNWTQTKFDNSDIRLYSIYFTNNDIGYAVDHNWLSEISIVLKTTDGGGAPDNIQSHMEEAINIYHNPASNQLTI